MGVFYRKFLKRFLDIIVAITLGIVLIVPLFFVAFLVKLTSKGPVFFKQERFGLNSRPFTLYKFRSMTDGAPIKANSEFNDITSYITPFGMFIRKTSIDELPQLINIIKGDMSFIGPRPLARTDEKVLLLRKKMGRIRYVQVFQDWLKLMDEIILPMTIRRSMMKTMLKIKVWNWI